jgi:hypothetical protein
LSTHFLFIRIEPMAEGGRWAEVYFSDQAEAGDPKFVDNIASTQLQPLGAWRELRPAFPSLPWQRLIPPGQRRTGLVCSAGDRSRAFREWDPNRGGIRSW